VQYILNLIIHFAVDAKAAAQQVASAAAHEEGGVARSTANGDVGTGTGTGTGSAAGTGGHAPPLQVSIVYCSPPSSTVIKGQRAWPIYPLLLLWAWHWHACNCI